MEIEFDLARIPGWPTGVPTSLLELIDAVPADLRALGLSEDEEHLVLGLRADAVNVYRAADAPDPITDLAAAARQLERGWLRPPAHGWVIYPLDRRRARIYRSGRSVQYSGRYLPYPSELRQETPVPRGGAYLAVYGGPPAVLGHDAARAAIERLCTEAPVADVLLHELRSGQAPTTWSLRIGFGRQAGHPVEFPSEVMEGWKGGGPWAPTA